MVNYELFQHIWRKRKFLRFFIKKNVRKLLILKKYIQKYIFPIDFNVNFNRFIKINFI